MKSNNSQLSIINFFISPIEEAVNILPKPINYLSLMVLIILTSIPIVFSIFFVSDIPNIEEEFELSKSIETTFTIIGIGLSTISLFFNLFVSSIYFYFATKFFSSDTFFSQWFKLVSVASIISLFGTSLNTMVFAKTGILNITSIGPLIGYWVKEYESIFAPIDIFNLWYLFLLWIGAIVIGNITKKQSLILVVLYLCVQMLLSFTMNSFN